jgi:hypothetical protein
MEHDLDLKREIIGALYSACEWYSRFYTSINSYKIKFSPIVNDTQLYVVQSV